jgi:hypothetical protein
MCAAGNLTGVTERCEIMSIRRAYYSAPVVEFLTENSDAIVGTITYSHSQDIVHGQSKAWRSQVELLRAQLSGMTCGHIFFEFVIPRMGKRADVVLLIDGVVFVLEFKIGSEHFAAGDVRQVESYALDLKYFHEGSHNLPIIPVLVATSAPTSMPLLTPASYDVFEPVRSNGTDLWQIVHRGRQVAPYSNIDPCLWAQERYKPTPTIVEAAQALYAKHSVDDIARNDAGARNLAITSSRLQDIIHHSRAHGRKSICFVTGVPGAGKTLVGLNVATSSPKYEDAVFLSGNGPLVAVLREALSRDEVARTPGLRKSDADQRVKAFVQNIHHFRDDALGSTQAPTERVVVFDEAQRAWDLPHTSKFMTTKRNIPRFDLSEPEFLVGVMDRHQEWCVIVALVGGGQEINSGEIGLAGWRDAIGDRYPSWDVYYSDMLGHGEYVGKDVVFSQLTNEVCIADPGLHLAASMRSFRAEALSEFVHHLVAGRAVEAHRVYQNFKDRYPIRLTRAMFISSTRHRGRSPGCPGE